MLIALHLLLVVALLIAPFVVAMVLCRRFSEPRAIIGMGMLVGLGGELLRSLLGRVIGQPALDAFAESSVPVAFLSTEEGQVTTGALFNAFLGGLFMTVSLVVTLYLVRRFALGDVLAPKSESTAEPVEGNLQNHEVTSKLAMPSRPQALLLGIGASIVLLASAVFPELMLLLVVTLVGEDGTYADVQNLGFDDRAAVRVGMRVLNFWERLWWEPLLYAVSWIFAGALVAFALAAWCDASGKKRVVLFALLAGSFFLSALWPAYHAVFFAVGAALAWFSWRKQTATDSGATSTEP